MQALLRDGGAPLDPAAVGELVRRYLRALRAVPPLADPDEPLSLRMTARLR
jgi:hypothetical protein